MAFYPKIQSPCPYKSQLASIMEGDVCRMCRRQVFDLTQMDDEARRSFFRECAGEVCVSYAVPFRPAVAAAAMAAAIGLPATASAQDVAEVNVDVEEMVIFVGGIQDPANVENADPADGDVPELPATYEDEAGAAEAGARAEEAPPQAPDRVSRPSGT